MVKAPKESLYWGFSFLFWALFFGRGVLPTGGYDAFLLISSASMFLISEKKVPFKNISIVFFAITSFLLLGFISFLIQDDPKYPEALKTMYLYMVPIVSIIFVCFSPGRLIGVWVRVLAVFLIVQSIFFCFVYLVNAAGVDFVGLSVYKRSGFQRLSGFMGSPNYFGVAFVTSYLCYSLMRNRLGMKVYVSLEILVRVCVILTFSRAAIISILFYDILRILIASKIRFSMKRVSLSIFVAAVAMGSLYVVFKDDYESIYEKISATVEYRVEDLGSSGSGRFDIWEEAGEHLENTKYALIGVGPGQYFGMQNVDNQTHNSYMKLIVESGVIGFLLYILWLGVVLYGVVSNNMRLELAAFLTILLFSMGNDVFLTKGFSLLAATILLFLVEREGVDEQRA
ncbi:O-antigen ligase family protein [Alcanivoracaceae bacterium MT1]